MLSIALVATACVPAPPPPVVTPSTAEPDYANGLDKMCTIRPAGRETSAPYPPASLVPVGQSADARIARLELSQAAQLHDEVAGKQPRGVYVLVQVAEQYIGTSVYGLTASPFDFQLIDPHGTVHCAIASPTKALNLPAFPDLKDVFIWEIPLLPNQPPTTFWLAFDLDPHLVAGSYLLASNMTLTESVNLDLGLT